MSDDHGHGHAPPPPSSGPLGKPELLTMFGFVKPDYADQWNREFKPLSEAQRRKKVRELGAKAIEMAHQERIEVVDEQFDVSGFPGGAARLHLVLESATENVEDSYFMILELARHAWGLPLVYKTSDYFAATENSAFFGNSQQRIGIQQDRVQQFLANIGKFVKELFQMVRELRIIDERLTIYEAAGNLPANPYKKKDEHDHAGAGTGHGHSKSPAQRSHAADVTLKSYFTDLAEGGSKNPQSVFGLAQQVNFTLLPDLFFNEYIGKKEDVDATTKASRRY